MPEPLDSPPAPISPHDVRARLAHAALGLAPHPDDPHVGPLTLHPHQQHAAARLRYALRHYRTALLADDVGLGKTAVALALLRHAPDAIVVAPAALRPHWSAALHSAGLTRRLLSTESLGRDPGATTASPTTAPPPLIVVDEAHHFRNAATQRWQHLAALAANARVLLLSATPVHNRPDDLATLFRLALGDHARTLDAATLARLVVRRSATDLAALHSPNDRPPVAPTVWLPLDDAPDVLDALRALPAAVAPRDGTATPDLDRYTLVRLWTSSDAALRAAVQRRRARALTVADAIATGVPPTRADLRTLTRGIETDPTTQQLSLLGPTANGTIEYATPTSARAAVDRYVAALHHVRTALRAVDSDQRRIADLRAIRARHPAAHVVAFSWSADTVRALYRALAPDGRVAMLTASGGRIASGPLSRADTLARFAPLGQSRPQPPSIERITLLLTTDALSEGLDLRDASVVVHLDLPWTPARLAQRTGRAVRPGAPTPLVHVYAFQPPPAAATDLRLAAHARAKQRAADRTVGRSPLDAALAPHDDCTAQPRRRSANAHLARDRRLERWSATCRSLELTRTRRAPRTCTAAALRCGTTGYLAVVALPAALGALRVPTLVAALGARPPSTASTVVRRALALVARATVAALPPSVLVRAARRDLARWARRRAAHAALVELPPIVRDVERQLTPHSQEPAHRALLARAARALDLAPPADRAALAARAAELREALARPISAERATALRNAAPPDASDAAWLLAASRTVAHTQPLAGPPGAAARPTLRALVLLID